MTSIEELKAQALHLKFAKADLDKQYFSVEGAIISIYAVREYCSVG